MSFTDCIMSVVKYCVYENYALYYTISIVNLTQVCNCFHSDTKILCLVVGKEEYISIKDIKAETEVKTYLNGYKSNN